MTPPPPEVLTQLADMGITSPIGPFVRYRRDQRHASWTFTGTNGKRLWLKIEVASAYFAGIANEARLLEALIGRVEVPALVAQSSIGATPRFLVTEDATGGRAQRYSLMDSASSVDEVAKAYAQFFACVDAYRFDRPTGHDLLVESPDLNALLARPLQHNSAADWKTLVGEIRSAVRPEQVGLVHGSLDPRNLVLGPRGPVLLDLEACRPGPASFDIAQMCGSLIDADQTVLALNWLCSCKRRLASNWFPANIAGFLIVRYVNRANAPGAEPAHHSSTIRVVRELTQTGLSWRRSRDQVWLPRPPDR